MSNKESIPWLSTLVTSIESVYNADKACIVNYFLSILTILVLSKDLVSTVSNVQFSEKSQVGKDSENLATRSRPVDVLFLVERLLLIVPNAFHSFAIVIPHYSNSQKLLGFLILYTKFETFGPKLDRLIWTCGKILKSVISVKAGCCLLSCTATAGRQCCFQCVSPKIITYSRGYWVLQLILWSNLIHGG